MYLVCIVHSGMSVWLLYQFHMYVITTGPPYSLLQFLTQLIGCVGMCGSEIVAAKVLSLFLRKSTNKVNNIAQNTMVNNLLYYTCILYVHVYNVHKYIVMQTTLYVMYVPNGLYCGFCYIFHSETDAVFYIVFQLSTFVSLHNHYLLCHSRISTSVISESVAEMRKDNSDIDRWCYNVYQLTTNDNQSRYSRCLTCKTQ